MIHISTEQIEDVLADGLKPVLEFKLQYPQISGLIPRKTAEEFNNYHIEHARQINLYARTGLYEQAQKDFRRSEKERFPFDMHVFSRTIKICGISDVVCSLSINVFRSFGTKHMLTRKPEIWLINEGRKVSAADFLRTDCDFAKAALPYVFNQIENTDPSELLPNAINVAAQMFCKAETGVSDKGFEIYYPEYTLRPPEYGISEFIIPYDAKGLKYVRGFNPSHISWQKNDM